MFGDSAKAKFAKEAIAKTVEFGIKHTVGAPLKKAMTEGVYNGEGLPDAGIKSAEKFAEELKKKINNPLNFPGL